MIELPHTIIGATIAIKVGNPALSLPLALLSHFAFDLVPHWNPHIYREVNSHGQVSVRSKGVIVADSFSALAVGTLLAFRFYPDLNRVVTIFAACFLAVLPDLVEAPYFFLFNSTNKYLKAYIKFHRRFQANASFWPGVISQAVVVIICLLIIFA